MEKKKFALHLSEAANERELTEKFLSGELSFSEYSERWSRDDEDDDNDDGDESDAEESSSRRDATTKRRRPRHHLTPALAGLMGEANLRYARGELDVAEKMCYEIIRQVPTAHEPFEALAHIFEADPDKSLQYALIAAHLNPSNCSQWVELARTSRMRGDLRQAACCYSKAIQASPKCLPYHMARCEVVREMCDRGLVPPGQLTPTICLMRSMRCYSDAEGCTVIDIAKRVAREFHSADDISKACASMEQAYQRFSALFSPEDLNIFIELLIGVKKYEKCLDIFIEKCSVEVETELQISSDDNDEPISYIVNCSVPSGIPIDLKAKLIVCLIYMKSFHVVDYFIDDLIENENVESTGDIYLDIEEALTHEKCFNQALRLLKILVSSVRYSLPAVWLKYAECLMAVGCDLDAIVAYKTVVSDAPQHIDARLKLSSLLQKYERFDEALFYLEQDKKTEILDTSLLYEKCNVLKFIGKKEQYLEVGHLLLSRHFFVIRNKDELSVFLTRDTYDSLKILRENRGESPDEANAPVFEESLVKITPQMDWELLNDLFKTACELKKFNFLERLVFSAIGSKRFTEHKNALEFACLLACYYNKDMSTSAKLVREFFSKTTNTIGSWNFFNLNIRSASGQSVQKFLMRLMRQWDDTRVKILYGNYSLMAGSYKYALNQYLSCYRNEQSAFIALLIGITLGNIATQKHSNKHLLVTQCLAFMSKYEKLRGSGAMQEIYYNIGRTYHQLGLMHLATQYYKRALNVENIVYNEDEDAKIFDLKREIAFNLHLIYLESAPEMAYVCLDRYIVID